MKRLSIFLVLLELTGCAERRQIAGMTPDMSAREASYACFHEAYRHKPENVAGVVAGGMLGGAAGGVLAGDAIERADLVKACEARHGWLE